MRVPPAQSGTASGARSQRAVGVAAVEVRRQPRETRAERERLDLAPGAHRGLQEHHHRARVGLHRAGDVDQITRACAAPACSRQARSIGSPPVRIDLRIVRRGSNMLAAVRRLDAAASGGAAVARAPLARRGALAQLVRAVSREVAVAQQLVGRPDGGRQLVLRCRRPSARDPRRRDLAPIASASTAWDSSSLCSPRAARRRARSAAARGYSRRALQNAANARVEDLDVVAPRDHRAAQRPVDVVAHRQIDRREAEQRVLHAARARPRAPPRAGCART